MFEFVPLGVLTFAAGAGVATFFAPCAFPLLPGYIGYYLQESNRAGVALPAAGVAGGAVVGLSGIAALVLLVAQPAKATLPVLEPLIGGGLVVFGGVTLSKRSPKLRVPLPARPRTVLGFTLFGAVYALAAAGCVIPLFLGVLTQALTLPAHVGLLVLSVYALGVAVPLVGVTLLAWVGVDTWRSAGVYTGRIQQIGGLVMVLAGLGQVYVAVFEFGAL